MSSLCCYDDIWAIAASTLWRRGESSNSALMREVISLPVNAENLRRGSCWAISLKLYSSKSVSAKNFRQEGHRWTIDSEDGTLPITAVNTLLPKPALLSSSRPSDDTHNLLKTYNFIWNIIHTIRVDHCYACRLPSRFLNRLQHSSNVHTRISVDTVCF